MAKSYANQPIFDAIIAATSIEGGPGCVVVDVEKFIDAFNNHRDRALCTALDPRPVGNDLEKNEREYLALIAERQRQP